MKKKRISRREFIGRFAGVAVGSLAMPHALQMAVEAAPASTPSIPDILVVKNGSPAEMTRKVIDRFGGVGALVKKGSKVVLKPNMTWALPPTLSGNTHPEVAKTVAELVMKGDPKEVIALDHPLRPRAFEISGVKPALEKVEGVKVLKIDEEKFYRKVEIPGAKVIKEPILVSTDILDADVIINIPNAKTHGSTIVTFGMKNWMGVIFDRGYFHRNGLGECIAELSSSIKPALVIVDATRITLYGGPNNRNPKATRNLNMLIAGKDQAAVDAYTLGIAQWQNRTYKPKEVTQLRYAAEIGVGRIDVEKLKVEVIDMKA
ncbi:DUF362 domain-containing protein [bacterium]|nr:DUF362 domain-containing protein [bacterium]